ncbi:hypothetical protein DOTSEDRAFT_68689 [Dothistroma septosporum NZE10]|uniref:Uncharacterized protein n=1 Tax=Dothistroma septosporum (strain NZE10 / CBS 128990) TaxID=675120 RepID=N1Q2M9_DOTSN|nr:hypothetical protein DOTSEDRAFT_68689 [Dothistroma septosporum NZE10]
MCELKVKADYSLSTAQVFNNFQRLLVEQQRYPWLFGNPQIHQMYEVADFGLESRGLPSWVPDLRLPFDEHPYGFTSDPISFHMAETPPWSATCVASASFADTKPVTSRTLRALHRPLNRTVYRRALDPARFISTTTDTMLISGCPISSSMETLWPPRPRKGAKMISR